jgi:hypothetical protein
MPINFTPHTEDDARKVSTRTLLKAGWCDLARIIEAAEKTAKSGKPMIEILVSVPDAEGNERQLPDWLLPTSKLGAFKFRRCCEAVGAMAEYQAGSISAEDFPGNDVRVKLGVRKQRGYPDSNVIEDYAPVKSSSVVNLRSGR